MFNKKGHCDWCKKESYVTKLDYFDGKSNQTCAKCYSQAVMEVKQFNREEPECLRRLALQL